MQKRQQKRRKISENETPKDEELKDDVAAEGESEEVSEDGSESVAEDSGDEEAEKLEEAGQVAAAATDATLAEAIHLADELVKTRIEKIHEAGERSVSQAVESMETLMGSV